MTQPMSGSEIRQAFIDFFVKKGHTVVPSSSLVPGGDQTLLFTNAGMVQFKDVFLGTDHRPYTRAVNSQKCMRVAGKHNDLEDVGRDDTHHTFFEMLGNWSFGDYYKKEAIEWAWELLVDVYGLDPTKLYATYFVDDKGEIPADEEAAEVWKRQPGMNPAHVLPSGRKDNFWEMADTGPCGPCSEIHIDRGPDGCDMKGVPGHRCEVNGECKRYLEFWNLVFIQYNRLSPTLLEPLPSKHVDTGLGFDRIVALLQGVSSNYRSDLFWPLILRTQELIGHSDEQREANFTPYRVIADHARAASFLIADGVVPGNTGRNYVSRMIIRRAARFGSKIGFQQPFLAEIAAVVIERYGGFYPELKKNQLSILNNITREEERFQRTVETGVSQLQEMLDLAMRKGEKILDGRQAFELYATHGLPFELTRDIAKEQGMDVDPRGFQDAMEEHRIASGAGKEFGALGGAEVEIFRGIFENLQAEGKLGKDGVQYDPYGSTEVESELLAIVRDGIIIDRAQEGDRVDLILPETCFYVEAGGQVSDTGMVVSVVEPRWEIQVDDMRKPAAGIIVHSGRVMRGTPRAGDAVIASVDVERRKDIMRNHTATHLLHAELQAVLGSHARQAGSLVAPDRLRFDFTHPTAMTPNELEAVEMGVNQAILANFHLQTRVKPLQQAMNEGAMALFGEKYADQVRTVTIGDTDRVSYELCGGTHVEETADIGLFLILSEGSAASGIRRIEAVTGRGAYELVRKRNQILRTAAHLLSGAEDEVPAKLEQMVDELHQLRKGNAELRQNLALINFDAKLGDVKTRNGIPYLAVLLGDADADTLRTMTDRFRARYRSGLVVLGSVVDGKPIIVGAVSDDLVRRGLHAGDLVKRVAQVVQGGGGGKPHLAQAGGKDPEKLAEALDQVERYVIEKSS